MIERGYVLAGIRDIAEDAKARGDYHAALRGYELLGKYLGLFTNKTTVNTQCKADAVVRLIGDGWEYHACSQTAIINRYQR